MGIRSFGSLLVLLIIVALLFGTKRLRDIGTDLAVAMKNFRKGLQDNDEQEPKGN